MKIKTNFIYPDIKETDRTFGATISGTIIRADGDWRDYLPLSEDQNVRGVESSACYIEAQQASIATIQEAIYGIKDGNYSSRFNALLSGGTEEGGDPVKGALSIKKDGLVPQCMMDFGEDIQSWSDFHSWKGVDKVKCLQEGKNYVAQWDISYKIVAEKNDALQLKYINLHQALKRAPVPISVSAWYEKDGKYYKPKGASDNHLVEAVYIDADNSILVRDTYFPHIKVLEPWFDFDFAMYHIVRKLSPEEQLQNTQKSLIIILLEYVSYLAKKLYKVGGEIISGIFSKTDRGN